MDEGNARSARHAVVLQQLLAIDAETALVPALEQACSLLGPALSADVVDVFLYDAVSQSLVAIGRPDSPIGRQQRGTGLDRLPLAGGGLTVRCFQTGESYRTGHRDREPGARADIVAALQLFSALLCRIQSEGIARGVLEAASSQPDWFAETDLRLLEAVARWMGLITAHAELVHQIAREAVDDGRERAAEQAGRLTRREREVAALVAQGLTNEEIAQRLVLVSGTASNHVLHILRKLGFSRRVQIATWAVQNGLRWPDAGKPDWTRRARVAPTPSSVAR
jgi:DNA-binding NarL/FixJ family response regulator